MIKRLKENVIMDNNFIRVYNDDVSFGGDKKGKYFRMSLSERLPDFGVHVIAAYNDKFVMFENYRYAIEDYSFEIVKGMGMVGKTPLETAEIEVLEEIGGVIKEVDGQKQIKDLGFFRNDMASTKIHCFYVEIEKFIDTRHEESEFISNIKLYSLDEIKEFISNGKITDMSTIAIFAKIF